MGMGRCTMGDKIKLVSNLLPPLTQERSECAPGCHAPPRPQPQGEKQRKMNLSPPAAGGCAFQRGQRLLLPSSSPRGNNECPGVCCVPFQGK